MHVLQNYPFKTLAIGYKYTIIASNSNKIYI